MNKLQRALRNLERCLQNSMLMPPGPIIDRGRTDIRPRTVALWNRLLRPFRPAFAGRLRDRAIVIDNLKFDGADVRNCELLYGGGTVHMPNCVLIGNRLTLFGPAANAVHLMRFIDAGEGRVVDCFFPEAVEAAAKGRALKASR